MYFNCAALQTVHYFLKDENLLRSYTVHLNPFDTYYNLYLTFYLNSFKIYHSTLLPSVDIVRFWIFIFCKVL